MVDHTLSLKAKGTQSTNEVLLDVIAWPTRCEAKESLVKTQPTNGLRDVGGEVA